LLDDLTRLSWRLDPAGLMLDAGFEPDPWQAGLLRSRSTRILLNVHGQAGKSTTCAALACGEAITREGSLILLVSRTQRQSDELFRKVLAFDAALGRPVPAAQDQARMLSLENGSLIVSLPGDPENLRGFSAPRLILVDEAARVSDAMQAALSPMLATVPDGRMIYLTTPMGRRGFFHDAWHDAALDWERIMVTADRCPRISPEFLADERAKLGPRLFAQEYMCSFEDAVGQVFSSESILAAFESDRVPLFGS
jgi:Terminase large subunit, T4likevirus-type, N-terminal